MQVLLPHKGATQPELKKITVAGNLTNQYHVKARGILMGPAAGHNPAAVATLGSSAVHLAAMRGSLSCVYQRIAPFSSRTTVSSAIK